MKGTAFALRPAAHRSLLFLAACLLAVAALAATAAPPPGDPIPVPPIQGREPMDESDELQGGSAKREPMDESDELQGGCVEEDEPDDGAIPDGPKTWPKLGENS